MSSSGFNLHHFSIMTEQVIVALMSSQLNDETALAIIISKPFRVVKVEFVVWRLLCSFNLQNEIENETNKTKKNVVFQKRNEKSGTA